VQERETALGQRNDALQALLDEPIDWRYKGFPPSDGVTIGTVGQTGWNLLDGSLPLPALVLKDSALAHNIALMAVVRGASHPPRPARKDDDGTAAVQPPA
jgi:hypothetical protein